MGFKRKRPFIMTGRLQVFIRMNEGLFLRNPEQSELGRNIIHHSIQMIEKSGIEAFTFKKLANDIGTTEAGIYRYFENKHRLLLYLVAWYWNWLEFQIQFQTNNISDPLKRLHKVIEMLASYVEDDEQTSYVNESLLHKIVIAEGSKAYLTKNVAADNHQQFFKPYKDLCLLVGKMISDCNPSYRYPRSLASTLVEMAHFQNFFMYNLPSLTDFGNSGDENDVVCFLKDLVHSAISNKKSGSQTKKNPTQKSRPGKTTS